jgi:hypothetical protein
MHRVLTTNPVRRAMTSAIAALIVALTLTITPPGHAQATKTTTDPCSGLCPAVYDPVTCVMSYGRVLTFSNRCVAERYAACNRLTIISCRPARG